VVDRAFRLVPGDQTPVRTGEHAHVGDCPVLLPERAFAGAMMQVDPVDLARVVERVFVFDNPSAFPAV